MVFFMGVYIGHVVGFYSDCVEYSTPDPDFVWMNHDIYLSELIDIVCPD